MRFPFVFQGGCISIGIKVLAMAGARRESELLVNNLVALIWLLCLEKKVAGTGFETHLVFPRVLTFHLPCSIEPHR